MAEAREQRRAANRIGPAMERARVALADAAEHAAVLGNDKLRAKLDRMIAGINKLLGSGNVEEDG